MEYLKKEIRTFQNGKTVNDQFYIDDDYNVPDAKKDVGRIIISDGTLQVEEMKQVENYLKVTGKLEFRVLYTADETIPEPASLEGRIPFEEMIYLEQEPDGNLVLKTADVDLTVTVIHSRKLNIKTLAEITIGMEKCVGEELTTDIEGENPVFKKTKEEELLKVFATGKDTYRIKEEVSLSGTKENIGTILWTDVTGGKADTQIGTDELLIQGELNIFCLYESVEEKTDWINRTVPYEGRIECMGTVPGMYHQASLNLTDVNVEARMDENGEMRILGIEATLEVRLVVYEEEKIQILEDMYMLDHVCVPDIKEKKCFRLKLQNHSKCRIAEELTLPELKDNILQICYCKGKIQPESTKAEEDGIHIEGVLHLMFLYVREDDQMPFGVWQGMGWGTIIYLAAITGISGELYEAAMIDGANRWQRMWNITLPGIRGTVVTLLIMNLGKVMGSNYERLDQFGNTQVKDFSYQLAIYIYDKGLASAKFSMATAVGIFQSLVGLVLVLLSDRIAKMLGEEGLL